MYWPYLRSKQNEVLAFRELAGNLSSLIVPIFKPVTLHAFESRLESILDDGLRVSVVVNSREGAPAPSLSDTLKVVDNLLARNPGSVFPAFELEEGATSQDVRWFDNRFSGVQTVLLHRGHGLREVDITSQVSSGINPVQVFLDGHAPAYLMSGFQGCNRVIVRDGFSRQRVNGDYPAQSDFDDLAYNYRALGFDGFGDCASVGDFYAKGGQNPSHVAFHLTEEKSGGDIVCNHFVSSSAPGDSTEDMYWDAMGQLVGYTGNPPSQVFSTVGVYDYINNYTHGGFKNLGFPKRCSVKHHLQMIDRIILRSAVGPFV